MSSSSMTSSSLGARRVAAFTLVELLVVIAIIGVLVGLLLPAVQAARESARRSTCSNNIRQLSVALLNYESTNNALPPTVWDNSPLQSGAIAASSNIPGLPWSCLILPYLEGSTVYDRVAGDTNQFSQCWTQGTVTDGLAKKPNPAFECPSNSGFGAVRSDGYGKMNYRINAGIATYAQWRSGTTYHLPNELGSGSSAGISGLGDQGNGYTRNFPFKDVTMPSLGSAAYIQQGSCYSNGVTIPYWDRKAMRLLAIIDGVSKTILLAESTASLVGQRCPGGTCNTDAGIWLIAKLSTTAPKAWELGVQTASFENYAGTTAPNSHTTVNLQEVASSPHVGGIFVSFAGGATQWIDDTISTITYRQLRSRCDMQSIGDF